MLRIRKGTAYITTFEDTKTIKRLPSIYIAYRWNDTDRWNFLRDTVKGVLQSMDARLQKMNVPGTKGRISGPNRLRGGAGRSMLEGIDRCLTSETILIADLSQDEHGAANANVLIELGMARARGARLFLVGEKTPDNNVHKLTPSDFGGWYMSTYNPDGDNKYSFSKEATSFRMQLMNAIFDLIRESGVELSEEQISDLFSDDDVAETPE